MNNPAFIVARWSRDLVVLVEVKPDYPGNAMRQMRSLLGDKPALHRIDDPEWPGLQEAYDGHWRLSAAGLDRGSPVAPADTPR